MHRHVEKEYLNIQDLADEYGIGETTFYRMIRDKKISACKMSSQWYIKKSDFLEYMENWNNGDKVLNID